MNRHNPVLTGMAGTALFMEWSRPDQIRFLGCEGLADKSCKSRVSLVLSWAGSAKKEPPSAQDTEGARATGFLPFVFSLKRHQIQRAVAVAPPSCKSPPGGVLSFAKAEKKERKKLLFCLAYPPCIFVAKNLIKMGRSRIQSPKTAPGFEDPRPAFCQLLGSEAKG